MIKNNKFLSNAVSILFTQIVYLGATFLVSAYAARVLGPYNIGTINYGNNYIVILAVIGTLGLDKVVIKDLVDYKKNVGVILGTTLALKFLASIILTLLFDIVIIFTIKDNLLLLYISLLQSMLLVLKLYSVYDLYYQSKLESMKVLYIRCMVTVLLAIIKAAFLFYTSDIYIYILLMLLEQGICYVFISIQFKKENIKLKLSKRIAKWLLYRSYHFILSDMLVMIYTRIDKIMLSAVMGSTVLGVYSVAVILSEMWMILPNAVITSARPKIVEFRTKSNYLYIKSIKQLYAFVFYSGMIFSIGIAIFSDFIINVLYGNAYADAASPLIILSVATTFAILSTARSIWLVSENLQKYTKVFVAFGALINITLNFLWIKEYSMIGISMATLITQIAVCVLIPLFHKSTRETSKIMIEAILLKGVFPITNDKVQ